MSLRAELREHITDVSLNKRVPEKFFSDDYDLIEKEVLVSMAFLDLITHLEDQYQIEIGEKNKTPENFASAATIANFVESMMH